MIEDYFSYLFYKDLYRKLVEKICISLAWKLPKKLVYWCGVRMGAYITTGQFGSCSIEDFTIPEMLRRWRMQYEETVQSEEKIVCSVQTIQDRVGHSVEEQRASQTETR